MNYARVEDGKVVEACPCPKNWRNVSGLDVLPDAAKKAFGWLPLVEDDPNCKDGETHDGPVVTVEDDHVRVAYEKRPITKAEKDDAIASAERAVTSAEASLERAQARLDKLKGA